MRGDYDPTHALQAARLVVARDTNLGDWEHLLAVTAAEYDPEAIIACLVDALKTAHESIGDVGTEYHSDFMLRFCERMYEDSLPQGDQP